MNCNKCGAALNENDQFCQNCGATVSAPNNMGGVNSQPAVQPVAQPAAQPAAQPMVNNGGMMNNNMAPAPNKGNPALIIAIILAFVVVALVLVLIFTKGKSEEPSGGTTPGNEQTPTPIAQNTYKVKFKNLTFDVPNDVEFENSDGTLILGDTDQTWLAQLDVSDEILYQTLSAQKERLRAGYEEEGFIVDKIEEKTVKGMDMVTVEVTSGTDQGIYGYAKGTGQYVYIFCLLNSDFDIKPELLETLVDILNTGRVTETSASIASDSNFTPNIAIKAAQ